MIDLAAEDFGASVFETDGGITTVGDGDTPFEAVLSTEGLSELEVAALALSREEFSEWYARHLDAALDGELSYRLVVAFLTSPETCSLCLIGYALAIFRSPTFSDGKLKRRMWTRSA